VFLRTLYVKKAISYDIWCILTLLFVENCLIILIYHIHSLNHSQYLLKTFICLMISIQFIQKYVKPILKQLNTTNLFTFIESVVLHYIIPKDVVSS